MRFLGVLSLLLLTSCVSPQMGPVSTSSTPPSTTAPASSSPVAPVRREQAYLDALRAATVPVSATGETEIAIGRGVCMEVSRGTDPEALADDLRRGIPTWTPDNVTAVIRSALETLC